MESKTPLLPRTGSPAVTSLRERYLRGEAKPQAVLEECLARANSNAAGNVYLARSPQDARAQAAALRRDDLPAQLLWGVPVSLKDCFDLAGTPTSCGSAFYRDRGAAAEDSAVAAKLRGAGAVITGKTHLHMLAYGITGENRDFGDCVQPLDAMRLTGGSSSGAAASVQEGSALAAIGTDTGGSIRVPAALCGLAGYRSSITLQGELWQGAGHLAPTFDTLGWLYRDLGDGPLLGAALLDLPLAEPPQLAGLRLGMPGAQFLEDCDPEVLATQQAWQQTLRKEGVRFEEFDTAFWNDSVTLFSHLQAAEAATLHWGKFQHFEPTLVERLTWGASITEHEVEALRHLVQLFRAEMAALLDRFDGLLLPCAPVAAMRAGGDHSRIRGRILRYTGPMSLAGLPVVTLAGPGGTGLQLVGRLGEDAKLLALSAALPPLTPA